MGVEEEEEVEDAMRERKRTTKIVLRVSFDTM